MKEILRGSLPKYVATEIRMLRDHGGKSNIMKIYMAYRDKERIFLVLDYFPHDPFTVCDVCEGSFGVRIFQGQE